MTNIELKNAELIMPFRNFSGREKKWNAEGDRNFCVIIPDEIVDDLREDGWNIKLTKPRDEDEKPKAYLQVAVKFKFRPPEIYVGTDPKHMVKLNEDNVGELDWADIQHVDLSIRPRIYDYNGKAGVKAYLGEMYAIINKSSFAKNYSVAADDDDMPF